MSERLPTAGGGVCLLPDNPVPQAAGPWRPSSTQIAAALAIAALVGPAALGGIPVLPVTIDDERRRQQEEILEQSVSSVGVHQSVDEAATALTLAQRRLAQVTREVEGTHQHSVQEADVVRAAGLVTAGEVTPRQRRAFRAALGGVAANAADLFMLISDGASRDMDAHETPDLDGFWDDDVDEDAWFDEF